MKSFILFYISYKTTRKYSKLSRFVLSYLGDIRPCFVSRGCDELEARHLAATQRPPRYSLHCLPRSTNNRRKALENPNYFCSAQTPTPRHGIKLAPQNMDNQTSIDSGNIEGVSRLDLCLCNVTNVTFSHIFIFFPFSHKLTLVTHVTKAVSYDMAKFGPSSVKSASMRIEAPYVA